MTDSQRSSLQRGTPYSSGNSEAVVTCSEEAGERHRNTHCRDFSTSSFSRHFAVSAQPPRGARQPPEDQEEGSRPVSSSSPPEGLGPGRARLPLVRPHQADRGHTEGAAHRRPKPLLLADLTNEFRLSRSSKPEEPGSRPASSPEFCVYDTLPPPGPRPYPAWATGSLTCGPACRRTRTPQEGEGNYFTPRSTVSRGVRGPWIPESLQAPSFPHSLRPEIQNSGKSRPRATTVPAAHGLRQGNCYLT